MFLIKFHALKLFYWVLIYFSFLLLFLLLKNDLALAHYITLHELLMSNDLLGMVFVCRLKIFTCNRVILSIINGSNNLKSYLVFDNKGNNKITELRAILQRESKNSKLYKQTKSVNNRKTVKTVMTLTWYRHF